MALQTVPASNLVSQTQGDREKATSEAYVLLSTGLWKQSPNKEHLFQAPLSMHRVISNYNKCFLSTLNKSQIRIAFTGQLLQLHALCMIRSKSTDISSFRVLLAAQERANKRCFLVWFCIPRRFRYLSTQIHRCLVNLTLRMAGTSPYTNQNAEFNIHSFASNIINTLELFV